MDTDEDDDSAMQELMGFSTFGNNKRQKLNTGAVSSIPPKPPTTSSNSTPLGQRPSVTGRHPNMVPASLPPPSGRASASPSSQTYNAASNPTTSGDSQVVGEEYTSESLTLLPKPANISSVNPTLDPATQTVYSQHDVRSDPAYWNPRQSQAQQPSINPTSSESNKVDTQPNPSYWPPRVDKQTHDGEIGYTSLETGTTLTNGQLRGYARGKQEVQNDGSVVDVFFKPSFVESQEALWGRFLRKH